ncbi:putative transposon Ty3-I Gag-Pol polyprotein [Operophtera brumata]|uniref:Putative transposon Ty3-I Gag-Pol polyprotein n=1 Tax=Operophtera brumata TaxID=104452 RepID=A0A0L7LQ56_OPEBR|nr:putative transposon Ty3-I Gag-Pol polyprotein [Operophtera brumata]
MKLRLRPLHKPYCVPRVVVSNAMSNDSSDEINARDRDSPPSSKMVVAVTKGIKGANLKVVTGYKIPFKAKPPLVLPLLTSTRFQRPHLVKWTRYIDKMVVEHVLDFAPETFLTPKSDGSMHPIINLKRLNHLVWYKGQKKKKKKRRKFRDCKRHFTMLKRKQASLREVQSIIGSLNFARLLVPQGRLKFRCLLAHCNSLLQNYPERPYPLPFQSIGELKWWMLN